MDTCIITIPVYTATPSSTEMASFRQVLTVLKKHNVCIFTFENCNLSIYKKISQEVGKAFSIEFFNINYFVSVQGYNKLCFSVKFYERFQLYEYMLIYQLDAWVFRDELRMWCSKGYDYIGAPIFYAYNKGYFTTKFCGIGNGGFSLRRISHCLEILQSNKNKTFIKPWPLILLYWNYFLYNDKFTKNWQKRLAIIPTVILKIVGKYNTINYFMEQHINEDMIFGTWSSKSWGFRGFIPTMEEAAKFSFEVHPEILYQQLDNKLPFGCHAFEKWGYHSFWKDKIEFL